MKKANGTSPVPYDDVPIFMARDNFEDLPQYQLPPGYSCRAYRPGDDTIWTAIQRAADPFNEIDDGLFERQYGSARDELPQRMWFIQTEQGDDIASISAWWQHGREHADDPGRIHWVVVHPDHQRRGITKPMMTVAMARLAESHPSAMLDTSSGRPWAVKVYLDFGFRPEPAELADPIRLQAWHSVQGVIGHPALDSLPPLDRAGEASMPEN